MYKTVKVYISMPGRKYRDKTYWDADIIVNEDTGGLVVKGTTFTYYRKTMTERAETKYYPFYLIKQIEITDQNGTEITVNNVFFLRVILDVVNAKTFQVIEDTIKDGQHERTN